VITGAGVAVEFNDTLSKLAVAPFELTARPTYTFCAIVIVWVVPTWFQYTPSTETYPVKLFPLRVSFTQYGYAGAEKEVH